MKNYFLLLSLITLAFNVNGQSIPEWQKYYGGSRSDEIQMSLENMSGDLVAVGHTKSKAFRGEDVLMRILDANGTVKIKQNFGGKKTDGATAFIQTYDGGYILVGYTNSKWEDSFGKADAWIVKTDETGEPLWHRCFGSKDNDQFNDVIQLDDGSIVAVGEYGNKPYALRLSANGQQVIWENIPRKTGTRLNALLLSDNGELVMAGTSGSKNKTRAVFLKMDTLGQITQRFATINDAKLKTGQDIVQDLDSGNFALVGNYESAQERTNIGLARLNEKGKVMWVKNFGGFGIEAAESLIQTQNGEFVVVGHTFSHVRGARRSRGWVKFINQKGDVIDQGDNFFGGVQNDYFCSVSASQDGSLLFGGASASNPGLDKDAWLVKMKGNTGKSAPANIALSEIRWNEEFKNDSLDAEERAYISFQLSNEQELPVTNLTAYIRLETPVAGLKILENINLGTIPRKQKKTLSIPIVGDLELATETTNVIVEIRNEAGTIVEKFSYNLKTKAKALPRLTFSTAKFLTQGDLPERNETIQLQVTIANEGNAPAEQAGIRFFLPDRVKPLSEKYFPLGNLAPNSSETVIFEFKAKSYYEFDSIAVRAIAFEQTARRGTNSTFGVKIKNFYDIENDPSFLVKPQNNFLQNTGGGPMPDLEYDWTEIKDIYWKAPDQDEEGFSHQETVDYMHLKIRVKSDVQLSDADFKIFINDVEGIEGQEVDGSSTALSVQQSFRDNTYSHTYITKVLLKEGDNRIVLKVKTKDGWSASDVMNVSYKLPRNNLHIYSIGVPHDDLDFTTKDAKDFASGFKGQDGKIFDQVNIYTFTAPEKTTEDAITKAMEDIRNEFLIDETIKEKDAILLFVSSHGFVLPSKPDRFRIAASNFEMMRERSTSVEFERDIIEVLDEIPNVNKFIFVDACYSGSIANMDEGAKSNDDPVDPAISKAIVDLAATTTGYNTIVSCSAGELSYEDAEWGNGSFTMAILEAFGNKPGKDLEGKMQNADSDNDGILTTQEIYEFLRQRVPAIVKTKRPKLQKLQNPFMPEKQLKANRPFYVVK